MTSGSLENTTTPSPVASFGRDAVSATLAIGGAAGCVGPNLGFSITSVRDVRVCPVVADGGATSRTVSDSMMISSVSIGESSACGSGTGASRASFAASSIVSRNCFGAHGLVKKRNTSLSLIEPSTASKSA